jgi:SH3-like domain-containing protein
MPSKKWLIAAVVALAGLAALGAAPMSVIVKETQIRATPSYMAKILAVVKYGDRLEVLSEQGGWAQVTLPSGKGQGWVHLSALSAKQVVLKAGESGAAGGASSGEVALAGKGFNKEVEAEYRDEKQLDYTWIDTMEGYRVSPEQILAFLQAGGLPLAGGAQ